MKIKLCSFIILMVLIAGVLLSCDGGHEETTETTDTAEAVPAISSDGVIPPELIEEGYIGFANAFVKEGVELVCVGYPDGVTYNWHIQSNLGKAEKIFSDNTGKYTPTEDDVESLITVSVDGYDDVSIYYSDLPVVFITSDSDYYKISKTEYSSAFMRVQGNERMKSGLYSGGISLHVRGNTTSDRDKKPFKLKLDQKYNILGIGDCENKHWCLLANDIDHTNLRNKILYDFSGDIGFETWIHSENVVLIYNNKYYGVYQLCEHVRVGDGRVEIYDWEEAAEDIAKKVSDQMATVGEISKDEIKEKRDDIESALLLDMTWVDTHKFKYKNVTYNIDDLGITLPDTNGGYMMEMDFFSYGESDVASIKSAYMQPLYFNTPEAPARGIGAFRKTSLYKDAYSYMQSFEYALHSDDFFYHDSDVHYKTSGSKATAKNDMADKYGYAYKLNDYSDAEHDGYHYSDFFDIDTLVNNFLFCEFAMNWDSMKNSFFYYKDIDEKAKIGPQWDFDWAWGNKNMFKINTDYPTSWHTTEDDFTVEYYYQKVQWNRMLIRDPYFMTLAYERYHQIRDTVIEEYIKKGGIMDEEIEYLRCASEANDKRWRYSYKSYGGEAFNAACKHMMEFVRTRVDWLDKQFESIDTLENSLGYYHSSARITVEYAETDGKNIFSVKLTDPAIAYVTFQINGTELIDVPTDNLSATLEIDDDKLVRGGYNCVEVKAKDADGNYMYNTSNSNNCVYNMTVSDFVAFVK